MKVVVLVNGAHCSHCYGTDNLITGLYSLLGAENVFDWPEKPCLHLAPQQDRDDCNISSDNWLPSKGDLRWEDVCKDVDLAIIATGVGGADRACALACRALPRGTVIAAVDASDSLANHAEYFREVAGRPVTYFKRELPLGERWAIPFPLSFPACRVRENRDRMMKIFYHATDHNGGAPGVPRRQIVNSLRDQLPDSFLDVKLYPGQAKGTRPSPEEYHERMSRCMIGISWNGAANWDSNRFWENFAYGLCCVAETPRIEIPYPFIDGQHCFYANTPDGVARLAVELTQFPDAAMQVAHAGHLHWKQHHSSEARARYLIEHCGGSL